MVWCGIAVLAFFTRFIMHQDLERAVALTLGAETLGFLLSGILREFYKSLGPGRFLRPLFLLQAAAVTLLAGLFQAGLVQAFVYFVNWPPTRWSIWERFFLLSISMWVLYMAWTLGYFWVKAEVLAHRESLRAAEALAESQRMELQLLRFQLDPHFLFNSLNGIVSEIPSHPAAAGEMVEELASYLRYSLDHRHQLLTKLAVEIDATAAYLKIQKTRFGDHLVTSIDVPRSAREAIVPSFLLQPLVENAFKHGFSTCPPPWTLSISAECEGNHLKLLVRNSGQPPSRENENGIGLDTVRRRLEIHYPGRHSFQIGGDEGFVEATLELEGQPCAV